MTVRRARTLETPEDVVDQYSRMIWRLTWRCLGKLPPRTTHTPEDLYHEGVAQALVAFETYRRTNTAATTSTRAPAAEAQGEVMASGRRRASFTTYLQAAVVHRLGKIVRVEWRQVGPLADVEAEEALDRPLYKRLLREAGPELVEAGTANGVATRGKLADRRPPTFSLPQYPR